MAILLKLNNAKETSGVFTNTFDENITLKPFSKIALLNAVIDTVDSTLAVDNDCSMTIYRSAGSSLDATIPQGNYSVEEFINQMTGSMNKCMIYPAATSTRGMMMKAVRGLDKKVYLYFNRCDNTGYTMATVSEMNNITYDSTSPIQYYRRDSSVIDTSWISWIYSRRYFTKGCGNFITTIKIPVKNPADPYFIGYRALIGLIPTEEFDTSNGIIAPENCRYCLWVESSSDASKLVCWYRKLDRATGIWETIESNIEILNDYKLEFTLTEGKLVYRRFASTGTGVVLFTDDDFDNWTSTGENGKDEKRYSRQYVPVVSLFKNPWVPQPPPAPDLLVSGVSDINFYADPYAGVNSFGEVRYYYDGKVPDNERDMVSLGARNATDVSIIMTPKLRQILGFDYAPPPQRKAEGVFISDRTFDDFVFPQNLKIETVNFNVQSYDSLSRGHRNILMTIPRVVLNSEQRKIYWEANNILYIALNNAYPITLNFITLQILDYENNLINLSENSTDITLLISD